MPFKSLAQEHFLFAKHPSVAHEFASKTSPGQMAHLPKKVGGGSSSPWLKMQAGMPHMAMGGELPVHFGPTMNPNAMPPGMENSGHIPSNVANTVGQYAHGGMVAQAGPMVGDPNMGPMVGPPMAPNPMPPMVHPMGPAHKPQMKHPMHGGK